MTEVPCILASSNIENALMIVEPHVETNMSKKAKAKAVAERVARQKAKDDASKVAVDKAAEKEAAAQARKEAAAQKKAEAELAKVQAHAAKVKDDTKTKVADTDNGAADGKIVDTAEASKSRGRASDSKGHRCPPMRSSKRPRR